jgi:hypothetical protein
VRSPKIVVVVSDRCFGDVGMRSLFGDVGSAIAVLEIWECDR